MALFDSPESVSETVHKLTNDQLSLVNTVLHEEMRNRGLLSRPDRSHGRSSNFHRGGRGGPRYRGTRHPPGDTTYGHQNRDNRDNRENKQGNKVDFWNYNRTVNPSEANSVMFRDNDHHLTEETARSAIDAYGPVVGFYKTRKNFFIAEFESPAAAAAAYDRLKSDHFTLHNESDHWIVRCQLIKRMPIGDKENETGE